VSSSNSESPPASEVVPWHVQPHGGSSGRRGRSTSPPARATVARRVASRVAPTVRIRQIYRVSRSRKPRISGSFAKWAGQDSNLRPTDYEPAALGHLSKTCDLSRASDGSGGAERVGVGAAEGDGGGWVLEARDCRSARDHRGTVRRMLGSNEPRRYKRAPRGSVLDPLEPVLRRLLRDWPQIKSPRSCAATTAMRAQSTSCASGCSSCVGPPRVRPDEQEVGAVPEQIARAPDIPRAAYLTIALRAGRRLRRSRRSALVIERVDTVAPRSAAWSARE
jgi:hypothetical protein